jgi:hypothetical protein
MVAEVTGGVVSRSGSPHTEPAAVKKQGRQSCVSLIPKKGTVYVVDVKTVRDSLQWLLEGKDYRVRCFFDQPNPF